MNLKLNVATIYLFFITILFLSGCASIPDTETGIIVGEDLLKSDTLFSQPKLGNITAIKILNNDSLSTQILVVGTKGVSIINEKGDELKHVPFDYGDGYGRFGLGNVQPFFEKDKIMYLNRGRGWQSISLFNEKGKKIWEYSGSPNDATLINLDSKGANEIIVGTNGAGGVLVFNHSGKKMQFAKASNAFSVGVIHEHGVNYIIHSDGANIVIRSVDGKLIRTLKLPYTIFEIDDFKGHQAIFCMSKKQLYVFNFYGNKLAQFSLEREGRNCKYISSQLLSVKNTGRIISNNIRRADSEWCLYDHLDSLVYLERYLGHYPVVCEYISESKVHLLLGCDDGTVKIYSKI